MRILFDRPFPAYLRACTESPHLHLVKTHGLPRGDERALVVVRDGRKALTSYTHFLRANQPASQAVLLSTVLGREGYGSWSAHVTAWLALPPDQRLVVAYEELVDPAAGLLERIQAFVGATGPIRPWINPFKQQHRENPSHIREGRTAWECPPEWTPEVDWAFWQMHGPTMTTLGYPHRPDFPNHVPTPELQATVAAARTKRKAPKFSRKRDVSGSIWTRLLDWVPLVPGRSGHYLGPWLDDLPALPGGATPGTGLDLAVVLGHNHDIKQRTLESLAAGTAGLEADFHACAAGTDTHIAPRIGAFPLNWRSQTRSTWHDSWEDLRAPLSAGRRGWMGRVASMHRLRPGGLATLIAQADDADAVVAGRLRISHEGLVLSHTAFLAPPAGLPSAGCRTRNPALAPPSVGPARRLAARLRRVDPVGLPPPRPSGRLTDCRCARFPRRLPAGRNHAVDPEGGLGTR